jgi:uncharacterized membrane protein
MERTSFGLDENTESALAYVLGFITGIFLLLMEDENRTVRFHALQSTVLFFGLVLVIVMFSFIPILALFIPVVWLTEIFLWLLLIIRSYRGQMLRLPVAGTLAARFAGIN